MRIILLILLLVNITSEIHASKTYDLKVELRFIETKEKNGVISHVRVVKGVSQAIDYEAKRVVRLMPKWNPAHCNGEPARTNYSLPIIFTLQ